MAEPTRPWTRSVGMRTGGMVERLAVKCPLSLYPVYKSKEKGDSA